MIYLAQVQKKGFLGKAGLRLIARQKSEEIWVILSEEEVISSSESQWNEGVFVLVELSANKQVLKVEEATQWIIHLIQKYLTKGITPDFLSEEINQIEQWRQSLTLQSQEVARRTVELEARREQLQLLEEELNREKKKLEKLAAELQKKIVMSDEC
jgi:predicted RNase H-like nuclease (RuvC/YqgF family)